MKERFGLDQVTARVLEQPGLQIEIAEGATFGIPGATGGEVADEGGVALDRGSEGKFLGEQQILHEGFGGGLEIVDVAIGTELEPGFIGHPGEEVLTMGLMFHHHQRHDVAAGRGESGGIEEAFQ